MSSFVLKIIALISMLFDHLGYTIFGKFTFMNYIGRLSFPIFAFGITEGYIHTKNIKQYFFRLGIFAFISQIPYMLFISTFSDGFTLNILFTLFLGLFTIFLFNKIKNKYLGFLLVILSSVLAQLLHFDYGWFGIAIIFLFYIFKQNKLYMNISFALMAFIKYFYNYMQTLNYAYFLIILFVWLSLIPINLYNGKKGKNTKYILYIFYPLHLIVLYLLNTFIHLS